MKFHQMVQAVIKWAVLKVVTWVDPQCKIKLHHREIDFKRSQLIASLEDRVIKNFF